MSLDGKVLVTANMTNSEEAKLGKVHLDAGKSYALKVEYDPVMNAGAGPRLVWSKIDLRPSPEATAAAKAVGVVIALVSITSELEGGAMRVNEPGFKGGDRTSLDLPKSVQGLFEAIASTGKPFVVLMNGSALSVNWAKKKNANAILEPGTPARKAAPL